MPNKRFKPLVDRLFLIIWIPTSLLIFGVTVFACFEPTALFIVIPIDAFVFYFLLSPLFGYLELRESTLFIKYGFILKKEIPYERIRGVNKERKFYSETMLSLKCAFEHVNVKYNSFDVTAVSVIGNDDFISELRERAKIK